MMNFSSLVLSPAMSVFGSPVTASPIASQPLAAPYSGRGVWTVTNITVMTEDGGNLSSRNIKLGIRLAEWPSPPPSQGDWISTVASYVPLPYWQGILQPTDTLDFVVDDVLPDGQGGAELILKRVIR